MAIVRTFTYTNTGTEIEFMQGLLDLLCEIDSRIQVLDTNGNPTTAAAQFADLTSSARATFVLKFNDSFSLTLQRGGTNNATNYQYLFEPNSGATSRNMRFMNAAQTPLIETTRTYNIRYIKSNNISMFFVDAYNSTAFGSTCFSILDINTLSGNYVGASNNSDVMNGNTDFIGNNVSLKYMPLLPYSPAAGNIDFIEKTIFVSAGVFAFSFEEIKTCTTMAIFSDVAVQDGRRFYAIGSHSLVEIDDEE